MPFNQKILKILSNLKGNGSYVCSGIRDFILPSIEIKGQDELSFPINKMQIEALIKIAHKAPFGMGSETVLDTNVRSAWEIDASQIQFNNSNWEKLLKSILVETKKTLGIETNAIHANLYKMLIYEAGDFFLPHKDSEKEKGMFGSLIIGLPSKHSGGELVVSFEGETTSVDFSEITPNYEIPFCAFYADCTHEIKPLASGYRVVLVYNLIQESGKEKPKLEPKAEHITALESFLKENKDHTDCLKVILLGHQYTQTNFSKEGLKGNDKVKAETLMLAAEKAGYYAKMGLVTSYQSGELESDGGGYGYRSRRSYYDDDDEDPLSGTMGEIYEEYITIEHWANDHLPALTGLSVEEDKLIKDFKLNDGEPDEKEAEGFTGNAGMEMQYWYHYGAVFLWQKEHHLELLEQKVNYACRIEWLEYYTNNWQSITFEEQIIAQKIAGSLEPQEDKYNREQYKFDSVINLLILKNDPGYLEFKGIEMLKKSILNIEISKWNSIFEMYEPTLFNDLFSKTFIFKNEKILEKILGILKSLLDINKKEISSFLEVQIAKLPVFLGGFDYSDLNKSISKSILLNSIYLCQESNDTKLIVDVAQLLTAFLNRDYTNSILIASIFDNKLEEYKLSIVILEIAKKDIQERVEDKPQPPKDWSRKVPTSSSYQKVWRLLKTFLESPTEQEFLYKMIQQERTEMENAIRNVAIDLSMETIKKGTPHTLKLTKNQAFYQKEMAKWNENVVLLEKIVRIIN
jgi:hypothetical protein